MERMALTIAWVVLAYLLGAIRRDEKGGVMKGGQGWLRAAEA